MQSLFSPGPWCKQRLPPRGKFLFPLVLWISCDEAPLVFKTKCSQGSSWCQNLMWDSELSPLWHKIIFQLMAHPPEDMGCDYILNIMPLLQCYFGFFFVLGGKCIFYIFRSFFFFNWCNLLWFGCFHERRWAQVLLLFCHLVSCSNMILYF